MQQDLKDGRGLPVPGELWRIHVDCFLEFAVTGLLGCQGSHENSSTLASASVGPPQDFLEGCWVPFIGSAEGVCKLTSFAKDNALPLGGDVDGLALRARWVSGEVSAEGVLDPAFDKGSGVWVR